jgi:iron(III) transport system permease protein
VELRKRFFFNGFEWVTFALLGFIFALLSSFLSPLLAPTRPLWDVFLTFQLIPVFSNTVWLMIASGFFSIILALPLAYFMSFYRFKGKKIIEILLILPLALPSYVYGFIYGSMTSVTGILSGFIQVFNLRGAILMFTLSLYPYVYLAIRAFLVKQPQSLVSQAKTLGLTEFQRFTRIFLPLLRPAIIGSSVLVMMEVLNDYGLVSYFGVPSISTAIFQLWFNGNDLQSATRLGSIVVIFILCFLGGEMWLRKHPKYTYSTSQLKPLRQEKIHGKKLVFFLSLVTLLTSFTFFLPLVQLIVWLIRMDRSRLFQSLWTPLVNTVLLGFIVATVILLIGLIVANVTRFHHRKWIRLMSRFFTLGYSLPGVLVALTIFLLVLPIERWFNEGNLPLTLGLTTSIGLLLVALVIRYLAIGLQFIESAYQKMGTKFTYASYSLQRGKIATLFQVDIPMMAQSLVAAVLIILIDVFKELPLTLFLRPFNFHTLATRLYQFANDEQLAESSLMIVALWLLTSLVVYGASQLMIKEQAYDLEH